MDGLQRVEGSCPRTVFAGAHVLTVCYQNGCHTYWRWRLFFQVANWDDMMWPLCYLLSEVGIDVLPRPALHHASQRAALVTRLQSPHPSPAPVATVTFGNVTRAHYRQTPWLIRVFVFEITHLFGSCSSCSYGILESQLNNFVLRCYGPASVYMPLSIYPFTQPSVLLKPHFDKSHICT